MGTLIITAIIAFAIGFIVGRITKSTDSDNLAKAGSGKSGINRDRITDNR